jgi:mannitol-1-/sugar-/sorbitol-6-phosphatase
LGIVELEASRSQLGAFTPHLFVHSCTISSTMPIFNCSAILFDLDGVLMDSTPSVSRQWSLWARENNIDPQKVELVHGRPTIEGVRLVAPHLDVEAEAKKIEQREMEDEEGVVVMPGAAKLLKSLPPQRWCVVTSGTRRLAMSRLKAGNLPVPEVLISADDVVNGKPNPEPYLKGAALLNMKPEECLVIEDAPAGIEAAHAAGMKAVGLLTTFPATALQEADAIARALADVSVGVSTDGLTVKLDSSGRG